MSTAIKSKTPKSSGLRLVVELSAKEAKALDALRKGKSREITVRKLILDQAQNEADFDLLLGGKTISDAQANKMAVEAVNQYRKRSR